MKKIFYSILLVSLLSLVSCANNQKDSTKINKQVETNTWVNKDYSIKSAKISNNTDYEATEEIIEETLSWETATITSFWSWENTWTWWN